MNRTEGLTKRNVSKKKDEASGTSEDKGEWGEWDHVDDDDFKDDKGGDDHESKDMKLTLMEEVLLLGLKDREVNGDKMLLLLHFRLFIMLQLHKISRFCRLLLLLYYYY